jgi:peptidyl-prolyl cis-trans isomerase SurA
VGDQRITVDQLERAIDQRLQDHTVAAYAEGKESEFTRQVLGLMVQEQVYEAAAERYDVDVRDSAVQARITQLLGDQDPEAVFAQLAQQRGLSRSDVVENVRQQLIRQQIAQAEWVADAISEDALRARYDDVRDTLATVDFGYLTVPDQATADAVVAQLNADPSSYGALAAQYAGTYTLPEISPRSPGDVPAPLVNGVTNAAPNTAFSVPVPEVGGVVVAFVGATTIPSFEDVRADLEQQASGDVDAEATKVIDQVREDIGVTINPRYGEFVDGQVKPLDSSVVDILGGDEQP